MSEPTITEMSPDGTQPAFAPAPPLPIGGITFVGYGTLTPQPDITALEVLKFQILITTLMAAKVPMDIDGFIKLHGLERHVTRT